MKTMIKTLLSGVAGLAVLGVGVATLPVVMPSSLVSAAHAADSKSVVTAAKARGEVGERADGYLGVVGSASNDVVAAVDDINIQRKSVYTRLASQQNVSVSVVAALSGEKLLAKAKPGEKIMTSSGNWTTK